MEISDKISVLLELISCFRKVDYWKFDRDLELLQSTNENPEIFCKALFNNDVSAKKSSLVKALEYAAEHDEPLICSVPLGATWAYVFEKADGEVTAIHALGPVSFADINIKEVEQAYDTGVTTLHMRFRRKLLNQFAAIPVLSAMRFYPYIQMLHLCVTGEKILFTDLQFERSDKLKGKKSSLYFQEDEDAEAGNASRHPGVYAAEQELFKMIEEGNINYSHALNNAVSKATLGNTKYKKSSDKVMTVSVTFITLSVRAAIRGGLPPSTAYSVGDAYEEAVSNCKSFTEAKHILDTMFDDFVHRVHQCQVNSNISKYIQACCDYIEMHIYEKIELEELADVAGYTKYYLTRKFKTEMGVSVWDYINARKVERAKVLLSDPSYSIQDISDMLNYCSRSYFSDVLQRQTGMWPSDYRAVELKM